jgi:hypothetical protein
MPYAIRLASGHFIAIYGFNNGNNVSGGPPSKLTLRRKLALRW